MCKTGLRRLLVAMETRRTAIKEHESQLLMSEGAEGALKAAADSSVHARVTEAVVKGAAILSNHTCTETFSL